MPANFKHTICLDFDGVCNLYDGWKGDDELFTPRAGLSDFISSLLHQDRKVAVFSTRPSDRLKYWFINNFPWLKESIDNMDLFFPDKKPPADVYIDDRGIRFDGVFDSNLLDYVLNFKTFWEMQRQPDMEK